MKNIFHILFFLILTIDIHAQNKDILIEDLTPEHDENVFPNIIFKSQPTIECKLNTFLQFENLEHLPGQFKINPFEKVAYGMERSHGSVFYESYYQVPTPKTILTLGLSGDATGAYSEWFEIFYNFDLRTGNKINLMEVFTESGLEEMRIKLNLQTKKTITDFVASIKDEPKGDDELIEAQFDLYSYCIEDIEENTLGYYQFHFEADSMAFVRGRCSNHAMRAIDDLGDFEIKYAYSDLEKHLSEYGKGVINGSSKIIRTASPHGKMYKGKLDGKYKITVMVNEVYSDHSLNMHYWYDKYKTPINWNGSFSDGHFSLREYGFYDERAGNWNVKAEIEAELVGDKMIGTWRNLKTNEVLKLELTEY